MRPLVMSFCLAGSLAATSTAEVRTIVTVQICQVQVVCYGGPRLRPNAPRVVLPPCVAPVMPVQWFPRMPTPGVDLLHAGDGATCDTRPTVVIDERVIHTGSYNRVRITGDVYTPSYFAAREHFERERAR